MLNLMSSDGGASLRGSAPVVVLTAAAHRRLCGAPNTSYDRDEFGPAWTDNVDVELGRNGCRTRDDILQRDLSNVVLDDLSCTGLASRFHEVGVLV